MRQLIIKLLFRLLDDRKETFKGISEKVLLDYLARQKQTVGFHEYWRKRDLQILKTFGTPLSREAYLIQLGRRLEHFKLLKDVKDAFDRQSKLKVEQLKKAEKNKP